jgi:hypothetical protein
MINYFKACLNVNPLHHFSNKEPQLWDMLLKN